MTPSCQCTAEPATAVHSSQLTLSTGQPAVLCSACLKWCTVCRYYSSNRVEGAQEVIAAAMTLADSRQGTAEPDEAMGDGYPVCDFELDTPAQKLVLWLCLLSAVGLLSHAMLRYIGRAEALPTQVRALDACRTSSRACAEARPLAEPAERGGAALARHAALYRLRRGSGHPGEPRASAAQTQAHTQCHGTHILLARCWPASCCPYSTSQLRHRLEGSVNSPHCSHTLHKLPGQASQAACAQALELTQDLISADVPQPLPEQPESQDLQLQFSEPELLPEALLADIKQEPADSPTEPQPEAAEQMPPAQLPAEAQTQPQEQPQEQPKPQSEPQQAAELPQVLPEPQQAHKQAQAQPEPQQPSADAAAPATEQPEQPEQEQPALAQSSPKQLGPPALELKLADVPSQQLEIAAAAAVSAPPVV